MLEPSPLSEKPPRAPFSIRSKAESPDHQASPPFGIFARDDTDGPPRNGRRGRRSTRQGGTHVQQPEAVAKPLPRHLTASELESMLASTPYSCNLDTLLGTAHRTACSPRNPRRGPRSPRGARKPRVPSHVIVHPRHSLSFERRRPSRGLWTIPSALGDRTHSLSPRCTSFSHHVTVEHSGRQDEPSRWVDDGTRDEQLLAAATVWHSDAGRLARSKLWVACDAPASTGKISAEDVDRWVRRLLQCPEDFDSRITVQRIFHAAQGEHSALTLSEARFGSGSQTWLYGHREDTYIRPGVQFWRLLLLVMCYLHIFVTFCPHGGCNMCVDLDDFSRVAVFLCAWGALPLAPPHAKSFGRHTVRFHDLCDWALERLLRTQTTTDFFEELECYLHGGKVRQQQAAAEPLALL